MKTGRLVRERLKKKDENSGITYLQIMLFISENPKPLMKDVADFLGITPPSATVLIDNLVKKGQIKRISDRKDRRAVRLILTPKGEKILNEKFKKMTKRTKKILRKLTSEERKNLISILEKVPTIL